jgi:hypothetical protein
MALSTLAQRVASYAGVDTTTDASLIEAYLQRGAAWLIGILPLNLFEEFSVATTVGDAGLAIANSRFSLVTVNGYSASQVSPTRYTQALDTASIFRATELSPIFTVKAGTLYVAPQGETAKANILAIPTITPSGTAITTLPTGSDILICEWAGLQCLREKLKTYMDTEQDIELARAKMEQIKVLESQLSIDMQTLLGIGQEKK